MPNDPLYGVLFGERVRVDDVDEDTRTAVVNDGNEQQMTTLSSISATPEAVEPGVEFGFGNERATVKDVDEETGVIGYESESGESDLTLAESVTFDDLF